MPDQPELTEIVDAEVERVDGVLGPANGMPFLLLKAEGPQPDAGELVTEAAAEVPAEPAPVEKAEELERFRQWIGENPLRSYEDFQKAEMSTGSINDLPDSDFAYIEPGGTKDESGKTTPRSLRHFPIHDAAHVRNALARASQSPFGGKAMPKIRAAAKKFGVEVSKADGEPAPGSPAWEAQDAATLRTIAGQLADLRTRLDAAADRERAEVAAAGDVDDLEDAWDLDDACACLTAALGIVARLAFTEQQEALQPDGVAKAGRRLSAKTTAAIEAARRSLTELLGEPDPELEPNEITTTEGVAEVTKAEIEQILDAKLAPLAQALSERGPVTKEAAVEAPPATDPPAGEQPAAQASPAAPEAAAPADSAAAATPAPAAESVEKTTKGETDVSALLKSVVVDAVTAAVQPLEDRLAKMEQQPMPGGPFLRGAGAPQADYLVTRGQAASTAAFAGPEAVTKALDEIKDPAERDRVGRALAHAMHPYAAQARQG